MTFCSQLCAPQHKNSPRNSPKCVFGWGSAPDPAGGAHSAPPDPLADNRGSAPDPAGGANGAPPDPLADIPPRPAQFPPRSLGV